MMKMHAFGDRAGVLASDVLVSGVLSMMIAAAAAAQPCHRYRVADFRLPPNDLCLPFSTANDINGANGLGDFAAAWACGGGLFRPYLNTPEGMIHIGGPADSRAQDVNADRVVIGSANGHLGYITVAWIWRDGVLEFVEPEPPMIGTSFAEFADADTVLAVVAPEGDDQVWIPALYRISTGEWDYIGLGAPDVGSGQAYARDALGVVGGRFYDNETPVYRAFIRRPDDRIEPLETGDDAVIPGAGAVLAVRTDLGLLGGYASLEAIGSTRPVVWRDGVPRQLPMVAGALAANVAHIHDEHTWLGRNQIGPGHWESTVWFHGRPYLIDWLIDYDPGVPVGISSRLSLVDEAGRLHGAGGIGVTGGLMVLEPVPAPPGDMNCDAIVDFDDLLEVLAHWGPCGKAEACPHDVNGDRTVDNAEALNVLLHWTP